MRMRKLLAMATAMAGAFVLVGAIDAASASAAKVPNSCLNMLTCSVSTDAFPGGTISVDADTKGPARTNNNVASWSIFDSGHQERCLTRFRVGGPPQSWTCPGVPRGHVDLIVNAGPPQQGYDYSIALRW